MEIWQIDIGDTVVCDICNRDYTESDEKGGLITGGYALCPECEGFEHLRHATAIARPGEAFKDFVLRMREDNTIGIC